jgi:DMSO/TMAO reductase YedYZ molybdopterin-dependent catalytic subunit
VNGLVEAPLSLSYDDLRGRPATEQYQTLECISNEVGGNLMSNARWTGTSLAALLQAATIKPTADSVIFRCADGYSDRLHLAQALGPRALIVYDINGERLPQAHGFPARLLVPGLYGMKNGKWLSSLEVASGPYDGYWEQRGWTREALVKLTARIDVPGDQDVLLPRATAIAGVAFSGDQGIAEVQVTTDAGKTWQSAALRRPLAEQTWVLWEFPWTPTLGTHVLAARAIDLAGRVQTPTDAPPLPDGASGYHAITVHVG